MSVKLHNTITRTVETVTPIANEVVTMYTCGPTVYLDPHVGNWRTFIMYDLLRRTLLESGYDVNHVLNITDVGHLVSDGDDGEDKLEKSAKAQRKTAWEVAKHYTNVFEDGLAALNILQPTAMPKATECIDEQISMVKELEAKGFTYKIDDGVYFDTSKFPEYGKMARLDLEGQEAGARVAVNDQKRNPQDFALWKFSESGVKRDMEWESPWGTGFPGWHLECSVMARQYLGDTIDIHCGGIDHIPVHHTNEIAQSEAANDATFSNLWLHTEFMTIDGGKMSKSLGNVYTLEDLKEHNIEPLAYRLFVLQAHYQTEANFTWEGLQAAQNRLNHLRTMADMRFQLSDSGADKSAELSEIHEQILSAMRDNLHTALALEQIAKLEKLLDQPIATSNQAQVNAVLARIDALFGLELTASEDVSDEIMQLIAERGEARANKDYAAADAARDKLSALGITVRDSASGPIWQRQ